ncbi:MAG: hypothetical protein U1E76_20320 [Planctomycetota bacterium]
MDITKANINVFVLGDLVLDHAVFVQQKKKTYQSVENEKVYEVVSRVSHAGGAANCARILATLSNGRTYLWGLTGRSPWGRFSEVLANSRNYDAATNNIHFRGAHDESFPMNTITRIIVKDDEHQQHDTRFDDVESIPTTKAGVDTAIEYIRDAHVNPSGGLHAVILNDLDMNALTVDLIRRVADFCHDNTIPLFVDPKRDLSKYENITATAILPNLKEWCEIVNEGNRDKHWRACLGNQDGLERMARLSLRYLSNFKYHIIKCDRNGAVIIAPTATDNHSYSVFTVDSHNPGVPGSLPHQLGSGDVMTAITALEYASQPKQLEDTQRIKQAFRVANASVACYRKSRWHRMPNRDEVAALTTPSPELVEAARITAAALYIPRKLVIRLSDVETVVPRLYSVNDTYRHCLGDIAEAVRQGWKETTVRSLIIHGQGGVGKSQVKEAATRWLSDIGLPLIDFHPVEYADVKSFEVFLLAQKKEHPLGLMLWIDEAFKAGLHLFEGYSGVLFLEAAHRQTVRCMFVDADFQKYRSRLSASQFLSRCQQFLLPSIGERPRDIPYVFAAGASTSVPAGTSCLRISQDALIAVVEWVLHMNPAEQSARVIAGAGSSVAGRALQGRTVVKTLDITVDHLTSDISEHQKSRDAGTIDFGFRLREYLSFNVTNLFPVSLHGCNVRRERRRLRRFPVQAGQ